MGNVFTFTPRPREAVPAEPRPMTEVEIRGRLGDALQTALDAADHIIAVMDRIEGDADYEESGDAEPALAAPENHHASQVIWLRGNGEDREADVSEIVLPEVAIEQREAEILAWSLPWLGSGNVIAAAGVALLGMVAGR